MWVWNKRIVVTDHARSQWKKRRRRLEQSKQKPLYKIAHASARSCSLEHIDQQVLEYLKSRSVNSHQYFSYYEDLILVFSENPDRSIALVTIMPFGTVRKKVG
ncbi:hypothetical protein MAM33_08240 [Erysipelothrix rhusiopathiae]|uniref:hypothetical protein n=1 Tax=Erysipelothrix rhusiopathiae TaxID=1648 RepID=UPI001EDF6104|nr:hypothetical protein [Erysipelothrix rhusiopathiae]MCG4437290.1 hypothetical protein [Erysipelothrix rhusiopathiae]